MSADFTSLFPIPALIFTWALGLALAGGPLLWRFLNRRPVTRRALLHAAWNFVATGCWITFGNGAMDAQKRGLLSLPVSILIVAVLFAAFAGGSHLLERWHPEAGP